MGMCAACMRKFINAFEVSIDKTGESDDLEGLGVNGENNIDMDL